MESIIVALIAGGLSLVGTIITVQSNNQKIIREMKAEFSKEMQEIKTEFVKSKAITDTKLEDLTQEVRRHNGFAERVPVLEQTVKGINEKIQIFHQN
jgi:Zn-dependent M32 family carboxypeptidase